MSMNDTARTALRQAVLNERTRLRAIRTERDELRRRLTEVENFYQQAAATIMELQRAADDPVEIDPSYPNETVDVLQHA